MDKQNIVIIVLIIILVILTYNKQENADSVSNASVSTEALANIASVYADPTKTVTFNNIKVTNTIEGANLKIDNITNTTPNRWVVLGGSVDTKDDPSTVVKTGYIRSQTNADIVGKLTAAKIDTNRMRVRGLGMRKWNLKGDNTDIPAGVHSCGGETKITDPDGNDYSSETWIIQMGFDMAAPNHFHMEAYVKTSDKKWYVSSAGNPCYGRVSVLAIPVGFFDKVWYDDEQTYSNNGSRQTIKLNELV